MTSRVTRRKKSSIAEIRVAVIGAPSVGKTAITVRFLTKRYIGEYTHNQEELMKKKRDAKYRYELLVDDDPILFEVLDTCPKTYTEYPSQEILEWADGICFVYSITDRESFEYIRQVKEQMKIPSGFPITLVANKCDMTHVREVSAEEGRKLGNEFSCAFQEVAAAEHVNRIRDVFYELCFVVLSLRRRQKHSLLDRMLGSNKIKTYARGKSDSSLPKE